MSESITDFKARSELLIEDLGHRKTPDNDDDRQQEEQRQQHSKISASSPLKFEISQQGGGVIDRD